VREKEDMQGQANKYGYYETVGEGLEQEQNYIETVRKATVDDVKRVARQYLRAERANLVVMLPKKVRPELTEAKLRTTLEAAFVADDSPKGSDLADGIRRYELRNGLRLIVKPTHSVPMVSMRLSFLGGTLAETTETQGLSAFFAEMIDRGTEQRSAQELATEVEGIAGVLEGFGGRNSFGLTAEFMKDSLNSGLELFADVLLHPSFPTEEITKVRADTLAALERLEDNPQGKVFEIFGKALYPSHPYRFRTLGTKESVKSFDQKALRRYYANYVHPRGAVLSVVGDVDPDEIASAIGVYLAEWQDKPSAKLPERKPAAKTRKAKETELVKSKNQVHLVVGFPGLSIKDPDAPALEVLTQILSGQSGRLFIELRDKRSLAYTTSAFLIPGLDPGSFGAYIASEPRKLRSARQGLLRELKRVLDEPIEEAEIEKARRYLIGAHAVSLQNYATQATVLSLDELYGLGAAHFLDYENRIASVGAEDLKRVAKRIIDLDAPVIATIK
jgi:zinc protease